MRLVKKMPSEANTVGPNLQWQDEYGIPRRCNLTDKIFLGRVCHGIARDKRIIVCDPVVSRDHAVIRLTRSGAEITDMSKNGTWINDVRMTPGDSRLLEDGDLITVGGTAIRLSCPHLALQSEEDNVMVSTTIRPKAACVTSLVANVCEYTALSQKFDSALVYEFIQEIFFRFSAIVNEHQGTVKDCVGDTLFAFWEHIGEVSSDQALSACQAAICQLRSLPDIHLQLTDRGLQMPPLLPGWGVTTGHITLSHYGSRSADIALVGDCVNLAFRLASMANKPLAGFIVMCRQTAAMVTQELQLSDLGNHKIRGRCGQEHLFAIQLE
jgi:class 3 adenylate cyclase